MQRFRFPLQKLLDIRGHRERLARRDMAAAMGGVHELTDRLEVLVANQRVCEEEIAADGPAAQLAVAMEQGFISAGWRVTAELSKAQERVEQFRQVYQQRRIDQRSLGRLRERRWQEWRQEVAKAEQQELDEVARQRASSRRQEVSQ